MRYQQNKKIFEKKILEKTALLYTYYIKLNFKFNRFQIKLLITGDNLYYTRNCGL